MGILKIDSLTQILGGKRVLDGLSMDIWEGHIHAVIGPNGAGKSTLANTIMGLHGYTAHEGDILLEGNSLRTLSVDERARLGITLAWQEPARFEGLGVRSFVLSGAKEKTTKRAEDVLSMLGMEPERYLGRCVDKTLSGGERKRIELASILAMEPRIVIMDEPDSGIDVEALEHIFTALQKLREAGTTVVMITHSLAVLNQADHAFLMCHGTLLDKGPVEKIGKYFENKCLPCNHINQPELGELS